jgi:hypothetical protein
MQKIKLSHAKDHLRHIGIGKNIPVMMWGQPGVGKSEVVKQLSDELNGTVTLLQKLTAWISRKQKRCQVIDIRLSQYDSVDLRGFPTEKDGLTVWAAPSTLPFTNNDRFDDETLYILFLDEINSASPAVSAVAYQLINDRRVGEHVLRENVVIFAAGNREGDRGVTNRQPLPLANRLNHIEVAIDVDDWCNHVIDTFKSEPEDVRKKAMVFVGFMKFREPLLSTFDEMLKKGGEISKSFASPRTWFHAMKIEMDDDIPEHVKMSGVSGAVGDGPAGEFWGWKKIWQSITPLSEILKNPTKAPIPTEAGLQYATAINVSGALSPKTVKALDTYLQRWEAPEFYVMAWTMAIRRDDSLLGTPEFSALAKKYHSTVFTIK